MTRAFRRLWWPAAHDGPGLILQSSCDVGLGGLQGGHEPEENSGQDGHGQLNRRMRKSGKLEIFMPPESDGR